MKPKKKAAKRKARKKVRVKQKRVVEIDPSEAEIVILIEAKFCLGSGMDDINNDVENALGELRGNGDAEVISRKITALI